MSVTFGADGTVQTRWVVGGWVIIRGRERYTGEVGRAEIWAVCTLCLLLRQHATINPLVISVYAMPGEWHFYHAYRFNCIRD